MVVAGAVFYPRPVDAAPVLQRIADALAEARLDAVLIGNAAAALQGAPVTTDDFDFLVRDTPRTMGKVRRFAEALGSAAVQQPYYPASKLLRVIRKDVQVDLMRQIHGVRSFEGLRARSTKMKLGESLLLVANLADVIKSKRAAARPKDVAVLPVLEETLREQKKKQTGPR
jgi:hypothetical protein